MFNLRTAARLIGSALADGLYPKRCAGCNAYGSWACGTCLAALVLPRQLTCPDCSATSPLGEFCAECAKRHALTGLWPAQRYAVVLVKELIHALKFEGVSEVVPVLAAITAAVLKAFALPPAWHDVPRSEWRLVPVPLPPLRERMRGYNQTELIAQALSKEMSLPMEPALVRRGLQRPQSDLTDEDKRRDNVRGVFNLRPGADIKGKVLVLVDDVYTSGATMEECARVLKAAEAREVWGLAIAKG